MFFLVGLLACVLVETGDGNLTTEGDCTLEDLMTLGRGRGAPVEGFHCETPGPHPGEGCHEWEEGTIDIGAGGRLGGLKPKIPEGVQIQ